MLREAYDNALFTHSWQLVIPGTFIALTVLAFTTIADGLGHAFGVEGAAGGWRRDRSSSRKRMTYVDPDRPTINSAGSVGALLEVGALSVDFESSNTKLRALDNVSLSVNRGEVMGVVGESGSGKTVTALSIMRLLPSPPGVIAGGSIALAGNEILDLPFGGLRRVRGSEIAMVFQDPMTSLDPAFTIGSQLVEAINLDGNLGPQSAQQRAIELLELVAIPAPTERMADYPHQLSGGMRQRVMIAMALARRPKVLIADEPTTALDVTIQAQVLDLLRELQAKLDLTVLLVTHDLGVIADICDRVVVMYAGQVVEEADVYELFAHPRHPYTHGLLQAMPQVGRRDEQLKVIPGQVPELGSMPIGCRFKPRCPFALDACGEASIELQSVGAARVRCIRHSELELGGNR
jgi:oligopeptide/dipeptide ABC transporter ATP-binding protein